MNESPMRLEAARLRFIAVPADADGLPRCAELPPADCLRGEACVIDLSALTLVDSRFIYWLMDLMHGNLDQRPLLHGFCQRIRVQMRCAGLGSLIDLKPLERCA